jgi:hypothetical protein
MTRFAAPLALAVIYTLSAAQMASATPTAPPSKAASSDKINTASPNTIFNFAVSDVNGVLLTCAKQQIDSDTFSGCTLAPGKTLDDLMTSIVRAIHEEQKNAQAEQK